VAEPTELASLVATAARASADCGREDLQARIKLALDRALRPATVVCVVGEFKQGKSSLVNALLGRTVCPVDDDLATSAVTFVHQQDEPTVVVRRRSESGELLAERIEPDQLAEMATERGNPDNERRIDRVEVGFPHPLLAGGLTMVDTPGMGGLGAGHAAATLAYLPFADGLLFVSDSSAELSKPELDFLLQALDACPTVLFCLTKTDLYPEWRRIADLDRTHLANAGLSLRLLPLSATVRATALKRKDAQLNADSGYDVLFDTLASDVVVPAKEVAARRALEESRGAVAQLLQTDDDELQQLVDPERAEATLAALQVAQARLDHLRGPGTKWQQVLNDAVSDLTGEVSHRFRSEMRTIGRTGEDGLEGAANPAEWEALVRQAQTDVARAVADVFAQIDAGATRIVSQVADVLHADKLEVPRAATASGVDVRDLWQVATLKPADTGGTFSQGMSLLQGMSSGAMVLGAMTRVLPAAAAGLLALNPVVVGVGLLVGGQRLLDQRKRKVATQRQQARAALRQFYDDVQFEIGTEIANALRSVQRELRDEFMARVTELHRTCAETVGRMQAAASQEQEERAQRVPALERRRNALADLLASLDAATPAGGASR
jgi:GTPase SAR1 family protein